MKKYSVLCFSVICMILLSTNLKSQSYILKKFDNGRLLVPQELSTSSRSFSTVDNQASYGGSQVTISGSMGSPSTVKKFVPLSGDPTIRIKLFRKDTNSSGNIIKEWTRSYSQIKNNPNNEPDSGKIIFTITEADQVLPSRYNYFLLFYLDAQQHLKSLWSEEFLAGDVLGIPIGTIFPVIAGNDLYFSALESQGWFLCDGRAISGLTELEEAEKDTLRRLLAEGGSNSYFNLPDLRGQFLRGATSSNAQDPDYGSRSNVNLYSGGATTLWLLGLNGNWWTNLFATTQISNKKLGSTQSPEVGVHGHTGSTGNAGEHNHSFSDINWSENRLGGVNNLIGSGSTDFDNSHYYTSSTTLANGNHSHSVSINNSTGSETRPKNTYVNYIMKCRR